MVDVTVVDPVAAVLDATWAGEPAVVVASPPGGGKSYLAELVGSTLATQLGERVAVAAQTNAQAADLTARFARSYPTLAVTLLVRSGGLAPAGLAGTPNIRVVDNVDDIPAGPGVILSTSARWSWANPDSFHADLLIVDEAWQMTNAAFALIAGIADRFLLVGDPGQIAPVTTAAVERWADTATGPHVPAPDALLATRPGDVRLVRLPHTRRLGQPTTDLIQPAFYPDLAFVSARPARHLTGTGHAGLERFDDRTEVAHVELVGEPGGVADPDVAAECAAVIRAALATGTVTDPVGGTVALTADRVGVVVAHVVQAVAVRASLGAEFADVLVDTSERFQGLERDLMVAWHPLSGRDELTTFARDAGRLCVMLSRHRAGCVLISRPGIGKVIDRHGVADTRAVGVSAPNPNAGWAAHRTAIELLAPTAIRTGPTRPP